MKIGEAMYKAEARPRNSRRVTARQAGPQAPGDDKVVDAEFEEVDDKKKKSA